MLKQPLSIKLFEHQLNNIKSMEEMEISSIIEISSNKFIETKMGILCDKTGFGKTLTCIGLIQRNKIPWNLEKLYKKIQIEQFTLIRKHVTTKHKRLSPSLILVSPSIIKQWETEINYSTLKYVSITTTKHIRDLTDSNINDYDIINSLTHSRNCKFKIDLTVKAN